LEVEEAMATRSAWWIGPLLAICALSQQAAAQLGRPGLMPVQSGRPVSDPMRSAQMRSDARLHDVCFVDPRCGWAVGDRGTIWHTEDGGRNAHQLRDRATDRGRRADLDA
jgi:photosystem II stability/assembly factor-like uncharacterized protein